jgi:hypothetical protein
VEEMIAKHPSNKLKLVWKSIKDLDIDSNGFLQVDELINCFVD